VISILTGKLVNRSIPHISLHHVTRFEPITAAHFDQRYNNRIYRYEYWIGLGWATVLERHRHMSVSLRSSHIIYCNYIIYR